MPDAGLMSIGVFARRSWLSPRALRLYERHGLLVPAAVDPRTGYRGYAEDQLADARLIRSLRQLEMPLDRIAVLLRGSDRERAAVIEDHWRSVERELARQRSLSQHLRLLLAPDDERSPMFQISVRDVPEQVVLTEQRHLVASELSAWIPQALARQHEQVPRGPGSAPSFVVFHGMVTEDSDGPAEVCTPVPGAAVGTVSLPTRTEPAHREAYVSLTRAEFEYPQILSAYRAVEEWVAQHGHTQSGAAREIYTGDLDQDTGPVCEVALPISGDRAG